MWEYWNMKVFLEKALLQTSLKNCWDVLWKKNHTHTHTHKNQTEFSIEKVIKKKGDKLWVKWKDYGNSLNSWIDIVI